MRAILELYPELTEHDVKSTSMGAQGVDVLLSTRALELLPLSIECKSHARFSVYSLYEQASNNQIKGTIPILVIKQNRSEPLVVLSLKDYLNERKARS